MTTKFKNETVSSDWLCYYSRVLLEDERIVSFSEKFDITPAQIIVTWLTSKNVCVIPKTNDPIRQVENYQSKTHGGSLLWKIDNHAMLPINR